MRILYLTNIHNPYRDEFFEQLGWECDLTVLFEERVDDNRDASWFREAKEHSYKEVFLPERENGPTSRTMLNMIRGEWSLVVVGCYNTPKQMAAISYMHTRHIPYVLNSDGMVFETRNWLKNNMRRHVLCGADAYLVAGETCVPSMWREVDRTVLVVSYPFSSFTAAKVADLADIAPKRDPRLVLIVGQFEDYKGLDIALEAAELPGDLRFRFVGSGWKARKLETLAVEKELSSIEVVPFLQPDELIKEYLRAGLFVLPSRQECWGLVVNEAAACGCPIVGTWGAAVEFLSHDYPQFLAEPGSAESLALTMESFLVRPESEKRAYSAFLQQKTCNYTIEGMVCAHLDLFDEAVKR